MKTLFLKLKIVLAFALAIVPALQLFSCGELLDARYTLKLPQPPESWVSLLGEPHWQVEWLNPAGEKKQAQLKPGKGIQIEIPATWASPVTAWPYWPAHNLPAKTFKPAGALFPFDLDNDHLSLSWKAGVDTVYYWELLFAIQATGSSDDLGARLPANFDWIRFRELFEGELLGEDVRKDPWLINWQSAAERTIASGFDRRRLVADTHTAINIRLPQDSQASTGYRTWYGTSPFAEPLLAEDGILTVKVNLNVDVWVSEGGILRCNQLAHSINRW